MSSNEETRRQLEETMSFLRNNRETIKPFFGLMFWELHEAERALSAEEFAAQGMSVTMNAESDETLATFMTTYIQMWRSAGDFNAATRFVAQGLDMSVDELLQTRQIYLDRSDTP